MCEVGSRDGGGGGQCLSVCARARVSVCVCGVHVLRVSVTGTEFTRSVALCACVRACVRVCVCVCVLGVHTDVNGAGMP